MNRQFQVQLSEDYVLGNKDDDLDGSYSEYDSDSMSGDSDSDDSSCWDLDEGMIDIERRVNEFSIVGNTPQLAAMVFNNELQTPGIPRQQRRTSLSSTASGPAKTISKKPSVVDLNTILGLRKSTSDVCIQSRTYISNPTKEEDQKPKQNDNGIDIKPDDYLQSIFEENGISAQPTSNKDFEEGFFVKMEAENFAGYDNYVAAAARNGDLIAFQQHAASGKPLLCCNKFQETTLHIICRRQHVHMLQYVLKQGNTVRIRDEQGRTPLHDAAWTHAPNFELVKTILKDCPDLLLVKDNRGFTPMAYVAKQRWGVWCDFLKENAELLRPKFL